ncbi:STAS domain-containing protein [Streptomyces sp. TRM68367]|uniref:STAS domain-containing protein n=1 Tax=Streptomyces sp. TRM68367 TaxID=2758415 RepID=UPI0029344F01|nr:STAS domain-containing protein [Streptomyces sp. TRM68367]
MASEPGRAPSPTVDIAATGPQRIRLTLAGDLGTGALRELEERFADRRLAEAVEWDVDMSGVGHLDLACAYALLRAATERPANAALTVHGARHDVRRTLRHTGFEAVAEIGG